jgi:rhomboid protease GluP
MTLLQEPDPSGNRMFEPPPTDVVRVQGPRRQPLVVYVLLGITILAYIVQVAWLTSDGYPILLLWGAKINELIAQGQLWRLFTPMLLHGSITHLLFNMYALYSIGRELETTYGHGRFLLLYVLAGFAGNVVSFTLTPNVSLGASTAIFGLLAAEGIFWYQNRSLFGNTAQRVLSNIIFIAAVNLFIGLSPGIDNWGHIGGLIGGLLFAWFAGPRLKVEGIYPQLYLVDQREMRQVWVAAAGVGALFSLVALGVIVLGF